MQHSRTTTSLHLPTQHTLVTHQPHPRLPPPPWALRNHHCAKFSIMAKLINVPTIFFSSFPHCVSKNVTSTVHAAGKELSYLSVTGGSPARGAVATNDEYSTGHTPIHSLGRSGGTQGRRHPRLTTRAPRPYIGLCQNRGSRHVLPGTTAT